MASACRQKRDFGMSLLDGSKVRLHQPRDWAEGGMTLTWHVADDQSLSGLTSTVGSTTNVKYSIRAFPLMIPNRTISRKGARSPTHPSGTPALRMPSMMRSR